KPVTLEIGTHITNYTKLHPQWQICSIPKDSPNFSQTDTIKHTHETNQTDKFINNDKPHKRDWITEFNLKDSTLTQEQLLKVCSLFDEFENIFDRRLRFRQNEYR